MHVTHKFASRMTAAKFNALAMLLRICSVCQLELAPYPPVYVRCLCAEAPLYVICRRQHGRAAPWR